MWLGERSPRFSKSDSYYEAKCLMPKNVTLKDVARRAGVSYQTVSKILRNQMHVTPEVYARVQSAVEELGYRPNVIARNLRTQSSHLIGYSWQPARQNFVNPILEQFEQSIVDAAERLGYHILLFPQRDGADLSSTYEDLVHTGRVDGFILSDLGYNDGRIPALQRLNVPLVAFGRTESDHAFSYVDVDGATGIRQAVEHLIQQGHRRIAMLGWPEESRVGADRLEGYWQAMEGAGLDVDPAWIKRGAGEYDYGHDAALELLRLNGRRRPTAIVTVFDLIALGAVGAIQELGYVPGRDVAVTGFDDMPQLRHFHPGLTSLRQPVWEVGQQVVQFLVQLLQGNTPEPPYSLLSPELVIRDSSQGYHPG